MKQIFIFFILFIASAAICQNPKEEISNSLKIYFKKMEIHDYEGMIDHIYPKFFEYASREIMLDALRNMMGDTTIEITFTNHKVTSIADIIKVEDVSYSMVSSTFDLHWQFLRKEDYIPTNPNEPTTASNLTESFKHLYSSDKVLFDKESGTILIEAESNMYMIKDPAYDGWKMLEKKPEMMQLLSQILPQEVINKW